MQWITRYDIELETQTQVHFKENKVYLNINNYPLAYSSFKLNLI
jgi:hypothetical protein